jgi:hypothetical protein
MLALASVSQAGSDLMGVVSAALEGPIKDRSNKSIKDKYFITVL